LGYDREMSSWTVCVATWATGAVLAEDKNLSKLGEWIALLEGNPLQHWQTMPVKPVSRLET